MFRVTTPLVSLPFSKKIFILMISAVGGPKANFQKKKKCFFTIFLYKIVEVLDTLNVYGKNNLLRRTKQKCN